MFVRARAQSHSAFRIEDVDPAADIVVVGLQEICELNALNMLVDVDEYEQAWTQWVVESLASSSHASPIDTHNELVLVRSKRLVGLLLLVFARRRLMSDKTVGHVSDACVGVGLLGAGGNKGAVGVRLTLHDTSVCIVDAHLASGTGREEEIWRLQQISTIANRLQFIVSEPSGEPRTWKLLEHDIVVFMGDLNFRLSDGCPLDDGQEAASSRPLEPLEALRAIQSTHLRQGSPSQPPSGVLSPFPSATSPLTGSDPAPLDLWVVEPHAWESLWQYDELIRAKKQGRGGPLDGFEEMQLRFPPTYKYEEWGNYFDMRPGKIRCPAWCDRVLVRHEGGKGGMKGLEYGTIKDVKQSDHRPVYASYLLRSSTLDRPRLWQLYNTLLEALQAEPFEHTSLLSLDPCSIALPPVRPFHCLSQTITLHNPRPLPSAFTILALADSPERLLPLHRSSRIQDKTPTANSPFHLHHLLPATTTPNNVGVPEEMASTTESPCPSVTWALANSSLSLPPPPCAPDMEGKGSFGSAEVRERSMALQRWIHAIPAEGVVMGNSRLNVTLTVCIGEGISKPKEGETTLVFRMLDSGRDYYLPVSAAILPSIYGLGVPDLLELKAHPISSAEGATSSHPDLTQLGDLTAADAPAGTLHESRKAKGGSPHPMPKELWWLMSFVYETIRRRQLDGEMSGSAHPSFDLSDFLMGATNTASDPVCDRLADEMERIRIATDEGRALGSLDPPVTVAATLKVIERWGFSLPSPLVSREFVTDLDDGGSHLVCRAALLSLPTPQRNSFISILSLMKWLVDLPPSRIQETSLMPDSEQEQGGHNDGLSKGSEIGRPFVAALVEWLARFLMWDSPAYLSHPFLLHYISK
mmetsp:Transcript_7508/g.21550  ORF Transcript_7508/g.21550 Transcript_7508/m.21550 type:complete len:866 (-) Transcript_7508:346-2943(-)